MKYLDITSFLDINSLLSNLDAGESIISGQIEAYSCKKVGSDKKLRKELEHQFEELSKSPSKLSKSPSKLSTSSDAHNPLSVSPFGPLSGNASRKTFLYLIATLNASYCDYDFSHATPEQFRKEPNQHMIINSINTTLAGVVPDFNSDVKDKLWSAIHKEVDLPKADIYSYISDMTSDPFMEEGVIWSFNYFFYNRALKRIVFFKCRSISKSSLAAGAVTGARSRVWNSGDDSSDEEDESMFEPAQMNFGDMEFDTTSILI